MKKLFAALCAAALGLVAATSCIEDEYDLDKDIDETIELKNFTFKLKDTYTFGIREILLAKYPLDALIINVSDISVNLKDGVLGEFVIDGIADDLTEDYLFKHGVVKATMINDLPEPFTLTVAATDKSGNAVPGITATCSPQVIPTGTSTVTLDVRGGGNINFDGVRFTLSMDKTSVKFNKDQKVTVKDFVISFPDGISKKGK